MKSREVQSRIEAAGWKKIRSEGSHAVFEHPKYGRQSIGFGAPTRDLNKRRLLEVVKSFHLVEIEQAKIAARLEEAKRRPEPARVTLARVVPEPQPLIEVSDQEIRILWAQLHKEHGETIQKLGRSLSVSTGDLTDFLYHSKPLAASDRTRLAKYMTIQESIHNLTRSRDELLKRGYGGRTGSSNEVDPFMAVLREAIQKTLNAGGITYTDLANTIGVGPSVLYGINGGRSKTLHSESKAKLRKWWEENWSEPAPQTPQEPQEAPKVVTLDSDRPSIDDELVAIQIVLNAVKPLGSLTAKRALRYVLERMD